MCWGSTTEGNRETPGLDKMRLGLLCGLSGSVEGCGRPLPLPLFRLDGGSSPPLIPCWLQAVQGVNLTQGGRCPLTVVPRGCGELGLQQLEFKSSVRDDLGVQQSAGRCSHSLESADLRGTVVTAALVSSLGKLEPEDRPQGGGEGFRGAMSPHSSQALGERRDPSHQRWGLCSAPHNGSGPLGVA